MALIGDSQTSKFFISMAEVRLGPMEKAMRLLPTHSIGLLNSATVSFAAESVDLEAGLPRKIYDTQIISQLGTVAMEMREYSRRNMQFLLSYAPEEYTDQVIDTLTGVVAADLPSTVLAVSDGNNFTIGDVVLIYPSDITMQGNVSYARVTDVTINDVTVVTNTLEMGLPFGYAAGDYVVKSQPIPIGANSTTQYFTAQVLGTDRQGVPIGFTLWKCALASGLEVGFNADDFNTNAGELKILTPSAADISSGGSLEGVADLVTAFPQGMATFGGDR